MRVAQGGTRMWCPACKTTTVCTAINPSEIASESGQRWFRKDHEDVNWFRRGRICQICGLRFLTAELDEDFVDELVELRDALAEVRQHAESYMRESKTASDSLQKLSGSLGVLRALKVYDQAGAAEAANETLVDKARQLLESQFTMIGDTGKLVGFQSSWGRQLALNLETRALHLFTEPVLDVLPTWFHELHVRSYAKDASRHSNLRANAPNLAQGESADYWRFDSMDDLELFVAAYRAIR